MRVTAERGLADPALRTLWLAWTDLGTGVAIVLFSALSRRFSRAQCVRDVGNANLRSLSRRLCRAIGGGDLPMTASRRELLEAPGVLTAAGIVMSGESHSGQQPGISAGIGRATAEIGGEQNRPTLLSVGLVIPHKIGPRTGISHATH
jgi:hypothetical protein